MQTATFATFLPGTQVQTLSGESDTEAGDVERFAEAGTWGCITSLNHTDSDGLRTWNVRFPSGTTVALTEQEMTDPTQYRTQAPGTLRDCCLYITHVLKEREAGRFTHDLSPFTALASHAGQILSLLDAAASLIREAKELDDKLDDVEHDGANALPPDGDTYNDLRSLLAPLTATLKEIRGLQPAG